MFWLGSEREVKAYDQLVSCSWPEQFLPKYYKREKANPATTESPTVEGHMLFRYCWQGCLDVAFCFSHCRLKDVIGFGCGLMLAFDGAGPAVDGLGWWQR